MLYGRPFIGPAGKELNSWLRIAGIDRAEVALTNVFNEALPPEGLQAITASTKDAKAAGWINGMPPILAGRHLIPEWRHHLSRLATDVTRVAPHLIVALGDQALWASSGSFGITARRGTIYRSVWGPPAIATYHPAALIRGGWKYRPAAIFDMIKARHVLEEGDQVPLRTLEVCPSLSDLECWRERLAAASLISLDIETNTILRQITRISFTDSATWSCCVPFVKRDKSSYWTTLAEEVDAWEFVRAVCALPAHKLLQNGIYDVQWLWTVQHIPVLNYLEDTRLMHHALFPELPKSLGFMATLWENEFDWKSMGKIDTDKGDD